MAKRLGEKKGKKLMFNKIHGRISVPGSGEAGPERQAGHRLRQQDCRGERETDEGSVVHPVVDFSIFPFFDLAVVGSLKIRLDQD